MDVKKKKYLKKRKKDLSTWNQVIFNSSNCYEWFYLESTMQKVYIFAVSNVLINALEVHFHFDFSSKSRENSALYFKLDENNVSVQPCYYFLGLILSRK